MYKSFLGNMSKYYKKNYSQAELQDFLANPHKTFSVLRKHCPVFWNEYFNHWLIFDYDTCKIVLTDTDLFSSQSAETFSLAPELREEMEPFYASMKKWMVLQDGENHKKIRQAVAKIFTPKSLEIQRERATNIAKSLIVKLKEQEKFDFIKEYATPLPASIFLGMLGVELDMISTVESWVRKIARVVGRTKDVNALLEGRNALVAMEVYLKEKINERRLKKEEDIISVIINANEKSVISDDEVIANCVMLMSGGFGTIEATLSGGVLELLKNPKQLEKLKNDWSLLDNSIEEILRYVCPAQAPTRIASKDLVLNGVKIKKGQGVAPVVASANRDINIFKDPNMFDISRMNNPHLSLGLGRHHCIGASLSRIQLPIAVKTFFDSFPNVKLDSNIEDWNDDNLSFRMLRSLYLKNNV